MNLVIRTISTASAVAAVILLAVMSAPGQPALAYGLTSERVPSQDFDTLRAAGIDEPIGIWSDGETMWVADWSSDRLYAFDMTTKARDSDKDFDALGAAKNTNPGGIWSDGETMWVTDWSDDRIYAYSMATGDYDSAKDFDTLDEAGNEWPMGLWSDGETMWVVDAADEKVYAYSMATGARDSTKDFDALDADWPIGLWPRSTDWLVTDGEVGQVYAYSRETGARNVSRDLDTRIARNGDPAGIWSDGETMWVTDFRDAKLYAYEMLDYDRDDDGLIEVANLTQLNAIRWDLDGDGGVDDTAFAADYDDAYPDAAEGMGCPESGCIGYELTADLDFDTNGNGSTDAGDAYWNDGAGWSPIGGEYNEFSATFDGEIHTISNLFIDRDGAGLGLFGYTGTGSNIKRIGLVSVNVGGHEGLANHVGGLVGLNQGSISDSYVAGSGSRIGGHIRIGGLVGINIGPIADSYATATVNGRLDVGGLVGGNGGPITNSYATGNVIGTGDDSSRIGGLVGGWDGEFDLGPITRSYASGNVTGDRGVGGLVGASRSPITDSYATGNVTGDRGVGGLIGAVTTFSQTVTNSYSTGRVIGNSDVGGLVGDDFDSIQVTASYWDTQTSGQSSSAGGEGKTTSQLRSPTGYTGIYADWNLDLDGDGTDDDPWDFGTSSQYPVRKGVSLAYDRDDDGLIEVSNLAQLNAIRWDLDGDGGVDDTAIADEYSDAFPHAIAGMGCPEGGCTGYELIADLDFDTNGNGQADSGDDYWNGGAGWAPIGSFSATLQGNSHSISSLYVDRASEGSVGLFSHINDSAEIRRVGLNKITVTGGRNVGGLVGHNSGTVNASYATGSVAGRRNAGGLVGFNTGAITTSYATGSVTGSGASGGAGGLVGNNWTSSSTINASYAMGSVTVSGTSSGGGGLVGKSTGTINASYAMGSVTVSGTSSRGGGLVGSNWTSRGTINASYAIGSVTVSGISSRGGGLAGRNTGTISASYWDTQTSSQSTSAGGVGKTTSQLQSPTGYTGIYADWNLDLDGDGSPDDPWDFGTSRQYPVLPLKASASPLPEVPQDPLPILQAGDSDLELHTLDAAGNTNPGGIWSNGETVWVTDESDDKVYAYSMATRARESAKDFNTLIAAGNRDPRGMWSDGETMWVADGQLEKVFAYNLTTKTRDPSREFDTPDAGWPVGLWSDGTNIWVADWESSRIYAYNFATKARDPSKDFDTSSAIGNRGPTGIWSDGETMWVADWQSDLVHAYDIEARDRVFSIRTAGNGQPIGIWSEGETMWVADSSEAKIHAYALPVAAAPTNLAAEVNEDGHVVLRWDEPDDDSITGYRVLWRDRDEDAIGQLHILVEDTGNSETAYTDRYVKPGARYAYRVVAINALGVSEPSRWVHVETTAAPTPEATPESVSEGDTDLPNDNSTPGRVAVGSSATGTIETPGDQDRFAVELEAGRTYQFDLTGSPGGGGTLPDTYFRAIYNSEGQYQRDTYNDNFGGSRDSRVTFTPTESGTYYARVSGDRDEVGTYTLSVTDVTPQ